MEFNSMVWIRRFAVVVSLVSMIGLAGCFGSSVKNLLIISVDVVPANPSIAVGATQQFTLIATFVDGQTTHESPDNTAWFSDNAAVATIDHHGVATGVSAGTANIKGSFHGNNTTSILTVTAAAAIAVEGDSRVLHVMNLRTGQRMTFAADGLRDLVMVSRDATSHGADGLVGAAVDLGDAEVSVLPEHGPAWMAIAPSGQFLYVVNQTSATVSAFAIDWETEALRPVMFSPFAAGAKPLSVAVDADGGALSVSHFQASEISRFRIDPKTGALKPFGEN
jgi:hypothetical protein